MVVRKNMMVMDKGDISKDRENWGGRKLLLDGDKPGSCNS